MKHIQYFSDYADGNNYRGLISK